MTVIFLNQGGGGDTREGLERQRLITDKAWATMATAYPDLFLDWLGTQRKVDTGSSITAEEGVARYSRINQELVDTAVRLSFLANGTETMADLHGYVELLQGKEEMGMERAVVMNALMRNDTRLGTLMEMMRLIGARDAHLNDSIHASDRGEGNRFREMLLGRDAKVVATMERDVVERLQGLPREVDPWAWFEVMTTWIDRLATIERQVMAALVSRVGDLMQQAWRELIAYLLTTALLLATGAWLARRMLMLLDQLESSRLDLKRMADSLETDVAQRTSSLHAEVEVRQASEERERHARELQNILVELMQSAMERKSLDSILQQGLSRFLDLSWLREVMTGGIRLVHDPSGRMIPVSGGGCQHPS